MKTKGLRKLKAQITFEGTQHPTSGCVFGFNWHDIKRTIENRLPAGDRVLSIKVTDWGIEVYHDKLMTVTEGLAIHKKVTGESYK
jgi:hypothetical protein